MVSKIDLRRSLIDILVCCIKLDIATKRFFIISNAVCVRVNLRYNFNSSFHAKGFFLLSIKTR